MAQRQETIVIHGAKLLFMTAFINIEHSEEEDWGGGGVKAVPVRTISE